MEYIDAEIHYWKGILEYNISICRTKIISFEQKLKEYMSSKQYLKAAIIKYNISKCEKEMESLQCELATFENNYGKGR